MKAKCAEPGCPLLNYAKSYCKIHYMRMRNNGTTVLQKHQAIDFNKLAFPDQMYFINDHSTRKAAFVARRSGKSYAVGLYLVKMAIENPKIKCLYFGLTEDTAVNVMWMHIIQVICDELKINYKYREKQKDIRFIETGSIIKLTGADATDDTIDKALGGQYKLVIFDECQSINHDLGKWINAKLGPAMIDNSGTICLCGTAGDLIGEDRYWYKITRQDKPRLAGWSVHTWNFADNPHIKDKMAAEIAKLKSEDPLVEETPWFQQNYLCRWVVQTSGRIYQYDTKKSNLTNQTIIDSLLKQERKWKFMFGCDFGFVDANAVVVGAFNEFDPNCYIIETHKQAGLIMEDIANMIIQLRNKYNPVYIVGDAQNKIVMETLRITYSIPIVPAQKLGKLAHMQALNSDFITGKIKVIEAQNASLIKEWSELVWNEKKRLLGYFEELSSKDNHAADAALYLHHFSKHYRSKPEEIKTNSFQDKAIEKYNRANNYAYNQGTNDNLFDDYLKGY